MQTQVQMQDEALQGVGSDGRRRWQQIVAVGSGVSTRWTRFMRRGSRVSVRAGPWTCWCQECIHCALARMHESRVDGKSVTGLGLAQSGDAVLGVESQTGTRLRERGRTTAGFEDKPA